MSVIVCCQGCGVALPPSDSPRAHLRKWCSERCRKAQYGGRCVDCGAPTDGSNGRDNAPLRCVSCDRLLYGDRVRARWQPQRDLIERLWAEGKTCREIGAIVGWRSRSASTMIGVCRARGYNLPNRRTPEQVARMTAANRALVARRLAA